MRLSGFFPGGAPSRPVEFALPAPTVNLFTHIDGVTERLQPVLDTLIIDTDEMTLQLVGRAGIPWQRLDTRRGWVIVQAPAGANASGNAPKENLRSAS